MLWASTYLQAFQGELKISVFWVYLRERLFEMTLRTSDVITDNGHPRGCLQPFLGQHRYLHKAGFILTRRGTCQSWERPHYNKLITQQRPFSAGQIQGSFTKEKSLEKFANPEMSQKRSVPSKRFCSPCILEIMGFAKTAHNRNHWTMRLSSSPGLTLIGLNNLTQKSLFAIQQKPEAFVPRTAGRTGGGKPGVSALPR